MNTIFSIIALILAIAALSKASSVDLRMQRLEDKLKQVPNPETKRAASPETAAEQTNSQELTPAENKTAQSQAQSQPDQQQPSRQSAHPLEAALSDQAVQQPLSAPSAGQEQTSQNRLNIAKLFAWIAGVLMVLGALFTFSYMAQKGLITISMILSLAAALGALMCAAGLAIKDKDLQIAASSLCAAGISICFISAYSAYAFFDILDITSAFAFMAATALISFAVSYVKGKQFIAFLAVAAAFLTPILLSSGQDKYLFFFSYLLIVNIPAAAIAFKKGWKALAWSSLALTILCQISYFIHGVNAPHLHIVFICYALFSLATGLLPKDKIDRGLFTPFGIFAVLQIFTLAICLNGETKVIIFSAAVLITLLSFIYDMACGTNKNSFFALGSWIVFYTAYAVIFHEEVAPGFGALGVFALYYAFPFVFKTKIKDCSAQWIAAVSAGVIAFMPLYQNIGKEYFKDILGIVPLFLALCYLFPALYLLNKEGFKKTKALFIAATIFFTTLILPVQFTEKWLTIFLAVYAAALCWLNGKINNKIIMPLAGVIFSVVFIRLVLNPALAQYCASEVKIFNWYMLVFGVCAAAMFAGAFFCKEKYDKFKVMLKTGGAFLLFALLNIEIADYFSQGGALRFDFSGNLAEAVTYTLAWAAYGAGAYLFSLFFNRSKILAKCGIMIICVAVVKLALVDLWKLDTLYRIFGVFGMAAVLIAVAFLFQKFNKNVEK